MNPLIRSLLAGLAGVVLGSVVNMAIVVLGSSLIAPPEGVDVNDAESIARSIHLFGPRHFASPFFAHALGTLAGAAVAVRVASSYRKAVALGVGAVFFAGGVAMSFAIPAPAWFIAADLILAYFPMSLLALRLARPSGTDVDSDP